MNVAHAWSFVERLFLIALVVLFAAMVAACTAQVIWRYLFDDPLVWSEELARYLFIWISYISAWVAWKNRAHIALDAVTYLNRPAVTVWTNRFVEVLVVGYCLYTLLASFQIIGITHSQPSAVLELPMSVVYAGYTVMALLITGDILVGWLSGIRQSMAPQALASEI
ncbi:TRAP transporter small permease [Microvirga makkahensis]|uniref:TRAP transporter small permease protein n=1 Tax=Microvirga makkahensis TaxID=1128670 RepID=A0A7X3MX24_9HYPH|nr:TRAP transporter small permease [Microvirga makkahensis]MXQ14608.1 TRAP transporter small permease subunit [Microvirga makkahensis]